MRKALVSAVALGPLCLMASQRPAAATDTVSNGANAPIATATATSGAPDDVSVASGGSVTVTGTIAAVTLNSNNNVTNAGSINIKDVNGATGVSLQGGFTGGLVNTGTITVNESYTAKDSVNGDGIAEAPFAQGTGRFGVRLTGSAPLAGSISNTGSIVVQGVSSAGLSVEAPLTGLVSGSTSSIISSGTITLTGDHGAALQTLSTAPVSGSISLSGTISATGQNSQAVNIAGDVGGDVDLHGTVTATGYATETRSTNSAELTKVQQTPTDIQQSGGAMVIGGNVAKGILIGAPPVGTVSTSTADVDGDGIPDGTEATGSVTNFGSAPALLIGTPSTAVRNIVIGAYGGTDGENPNQYPQPANAYGLIVRGSLSGFGVFDTVTATGLQIGTGSGDVAISGGIRLVGSVSASSFEADATAIYIRQGATVPEIRNEDFIQATISHSNVSTTPTTATAYGVLIEAGGTVSKITNYGTISASATGDNMSAYGVKDGGGGVTSVLNEGVISSVIAPTVTGDKLNGRTVALDLGQNKTGVDIMQRDNAYPISINVQTTTSASGTTTTTAATTGVVTGTSGKTTTSTTASTTASTSTTTVTTTAAGVTTTTVSTTPTVPAIVGDVLLGTGPNSVELLGGSMTGALSLGSGATGSVTLDNGASFQGAFTYTGQALALNVKNGVFFNTSATPLSLSSLNVGASGVLYAAIDPKNSASTQYNVTGTATLASGAKLGLVLNSPIYNPTTYVVVSATTLNNAGADPTLLSQVPFLLKATASTNAAAGTISINVRRSTAAEMGLNAGETAGLNAIYGALSNDGAVESAFFAQYTRSGFIHLYDQMLPDYAGGLFQMASAGADAVTRATTRNNDIDNPSGTRGAWAQEFAFGVDRPASDAGAYRGEGFGFVGGLETGGAGFGAFGLTASFITGSLTTPHTPGDGVQSLSEFEGGGYWQGQAGGFRADARVAGGYLSFSDRRELYLADSAGAVQLDRTANGKSTGWSAAGHFGASYQFGQGIWFFRPQAQADYFKLSQGGFTERGGGSAFDLALASRQGDQGSFNASLAAGLVLGTGFRWRPEVQVGYRDVFTGTAGVTTATVAAGGSSFSLQPAAIKGGGPMGRLNLKADTDFYELDLEAGAEQRNNSIAADLRFNVRILF